MLDVASVQRRELPRAYPALDFTSLPLEAPSFSVRTRFDVVPSANILTVAQPSGNAQGIVAALPHCGARTVTPFARAVLPVFARLGDLLTLGGNFRPFVQEHAAV